MGIRKGYLLISAIILLVFAALSASRLLVKSAFSPQNAGQPTAVIDAGHGGMDGGAVSADGIVESHVNLEIAKRLALLLQFCGQRVILTRNSEADLSSSDAESIKEQKVSDLKNRVAVVNAVPNAVLISVHQNSLAGNASVRGAQTFYNTVSDANALAVALQQNLNTVCNTGNHKLARQINSSIYLMNEVRCPAVLVECGFLSNPKEAQLLCTPAYQKQLALSVAAGYLQQQMRDQDESENDFFLYRMRQ